MSSLLHQTGSFLGIDHQCDHDNIGRDNKKSDFMGTLNGETRDKYGCNQLFIFQPTDDTEPIEDTELKMKDCDKAWYFYFGINVVDAHNDDDLNMEENGYLREQNASLIVEVNYYKQQLKMERIRNQKLSVLNDIKNRIIIELGKEIPEPPAA
eukprot:394811_1